MHVDKELNNVSSNDTRAKQKQKRSILENLFERTPPYKILLLRQEGIRRAYLKFQFVYRLLDEAPPHIKIFGARQPKKQPPGPHAAYVQFI